MISCSHCGRENPDDAQYCNGCGSALAETPSREERKVVTAVFVDLVGSTARAEQLDPEDVRALLRRYHETLRRALEGYGGTVEKFIGDAVVAVYGAPTSHEDDPERAVRAALAARDAIGALNERDESLDLHVRIGVATGEALVAVDARPETGESMVAGDVMNTAARIQAAAPVDGILVSTPTKRATERAVVFRSHAALDARGKLEPVEAWEALEARARVGGLGDELSGPLVGRDHERALLLGAFARSRIDRTTQLVTLVGVPGIGKSRLIAELGRVVEDDEEIIAWRYGRCLPYGDGVSFWALGEIVKAQAGIHENDDAATTRHKLADAVAELVPESEREWVLASLEPLVGLVPADVGLGDRRAKLFTGWRRVLEGLADRRPLVLVIDDLQWADDGLLDFVDGLVDLVESVPLLVVCCARPELLERRPGWGGGKRNALTVSLGPLSAGETVRLVESLLGRDPADAALRATVAEQAAGNPLYAEELVRVRASGGDVGGLPDSVLGIVTARVDLLASAEKDLLRHAAVMGPVVWSDGLRAVSDHDAETVDDLLRSLARKEFLRRERRSAVLGATEHSFVHTLVRDAVYGQLPRSDRVSRHVRVAQWIESLPEDRREDRAEMLAHHYLEAIALSRSAALDVAELEPRAAEALRAAGLRAFATASFPAAVRALRAASEWLPGGLDPYALRVLGKASMFTEQSGEAELRQAFDGFHAAGAKVEAAVAAIDLAMAFWQHGDGRRAGEWTTQSRTLVDGAPASAAHAHVLAQVARLEMLSGRAEQSLATASRAIELAAASGAEAPRVSALVTRATTRGNLGHDSDEDFEEALALAQRHDLSEVGRVYTNLSSLLVGRGDLERATTVAREGHLHHQRTGMIGGTGGFIYGNLCEARFLAGDWDEAAEIASLELDRAARAGGLYYEPFYRFVRAELAAARDPTFAGTVVAARALVELGDERGDDQALVPTLAGAAWMLVRVGEQDEAGTVLDRLLERRRSNRLGYAAGWWSMYAALALERMGRTGTLAALGERPGSAFLAAALEIDAARFSDAAETLRKIGAPQLEAEARILAARAAHEVGGDGGAGVELERARALLTGLGATVRLRELADELVSFRSA